MGKKFQKRLSKILIAKEAHGFELINITFSPNGFLTIEEKELKTILLGFEPSLINDQLEIIKNLKHEFNRINFSDKIDIIDLTDPNKPKIKVFKP
jgi:cell division protein FtsQ